MGANLQNDTLATACRVGKYQRGSGGKRVEQLVGEREEQLRGQTFKKRIGGKNDKGLFKRRNKTPGGPGGVKTKLLKGV